MSAAASNPRGTAGVPTATGVRVPASRGETWSFPVSPTATDNAVRERNASRPRRRRPPQALPLAALTLAFALFATTAFAADLRVKGMGWFGSRETSRTLQILLGEQMSGPLGAPAIEDAALILFHQLNQDGYLEPRLNVEIETAAGTKETLPLHADLRTPLPRDMQAERVTFHVHRGTRFVIEDVQFTGLTLMEAEEARQFFMGEIFLIKLAADRVYSPAGARTSVSNLEEELRLRGYRDAKAEITQTDIDERSGRVRLAVTVSEGALWRATEVRFEAPEGLAPPAGLVQDKIGQPWTTLARQNTLTAVRGWYYERGYPDVRVAITPRPGPAKNGERPTVVTAQIVPGPQVRLGDIVFRGNTHTRDGTMRRLVDAEKDELLNPVELDNAQARLARLGVFRRVDLRYDPEGANERDAVFSVVEGRRQEVNLLAGYGTYEQFRAGIEWQHYNLWGRAHTNNLRAVQSMRSSSADYRYTIPEIFGTTASGTARLFGLRREELAFTREEFGANLTFTRPVRALKANASLAYTFRRLRSTDNELATRIVDETQADVASLELRLVQDRRDNPLVPRDGHRVFVEIEEASKVLGGEVDYQQLTLGGSYHTSWGRGRWVHVGLEHGVVTTFGADNDLALPVNVRFFPGGENSIRGYRRGGAAPRAENGQFIGAKSYVQLNLEVEQAITSSLSAVVFVDALGAAAELADYPFKDPLYSVGAGLRYNTLIGPIRLEYGYNLNRRIGDPAGTVQLSIGFPF